MAKRYQVVFTPVGWQVVDTHESRESLAEFGTGSDEYRRAMEAAAELNVADRIGQLAQGLPSMSDEAA